MNSSLSWSGDAVPVPLRPDEVEQTAGMLARAFEEDVLPCFVFPDAQRRRQHLPAMFVQFLRDGLRDGEVLKLGPILAVAIWIPPHTAPQPGPRMVEAAKTAWMDAMKAWTADEQERFERFVGHVDALHERLMPDPHAYLSVIGTEPSHQGKGLGSALMAPSLARFKAEGIPCYLDTRMIHNVRFYERHGFHVLEESDVPDCALHIWAMRRD